MKEAKQRTIQVTPTIPVDLRDAINTEARNCGGISFSAMLILLASEALTARAIEDHRRGKGRKAN